MSTTIMITLVRVTCFHCKKIFGMESEIQNYYVNSHKRFVCPYCEGGQSYCFKSDLEKAKEELQRAQEEIDRSRRRLNDKEIRIKHLENSVIAEKGHKTRLKKKLQRVENGVCPDCNRSFQNLQKHMKSKHGCGLKS